MFLAALDNAFESGQLRFVGRLQPLSEPRRFAEHLRPTRGTEWVVSAKRPFAGPEQILDYLDRYTHRIAISNQRLCGLNDGAVRFCYTNYRSNATSRHKTMTLAAAGFTRRMLPQCSRLASTASATTVSSPTVPGSRNWPSAGGRSARRHHHRHRPCSGRSSTSPGR